MKTLEELTNEIPDRYLILFLSDWNQGEQSEMKSIERSHLNNLWLEYNKWDIQRKRKIEITSILTPEIIEGEKM
jgi:hypothetical protein